jgi:uncharacterized protein
MPELLHPGVYVNEVQTGNAPVEGVGTSTAAFIGYARRGLVGVPTLVTSWADFVNKFGYGLDTPFLSNANLAYSVYGFFQNGGGRAYIVRAGSASAKKATITLKDAGNVDVVTVTAVDEGAFGNDIKVQLSVAVAGLHDFTVKYKDVVVATYKGVSLVSTNANFIEYVVNDVDRFVKVTATGVAPAPANLGVDKVLATGHDGISDASDTTLINAFDALATVRANIIVCPESQSAAVNGKGLSYAESNMAFYVADGLSNATVASIQTERSAYNSEYGALYFPWIKVSDPLSKAKDKTRFIPVGGHIAGIYSRIDSDRGIFKAPAGLEAVVRGAVDVKVVVTEATQDLLNPLAINAVMPMAGAGIVVWGARTLSSNPEVRYINVRRSLLFIRESLQLGTKWAVFEPNNENLWSKLSTSADGFLLGEFNRGMFKGIAPEQAYFVKCDSDVNPQSEIDLGRVNMQIGVAINKPGEFLIINIGQWAGGTQA